MDGSNRRTLHSTNTSTSVGLALDTQTQTLYWSNGLGELESSDLDGSNYRLIITAVVRTRGLAVLETNVLYYINNHIKRINITAGGTNIETLGEWIRCSNNAAVQIVDQLKQPVGMLCIIM